MLGQDLLGVLEAVLRVPSDWLWRPRRVLVVPRLHADLVRLGSDSLELLVELLDLGLQVGLLVEEPTAPELFLMQANRFFR